MIRLILILILTTACGTAVGLGVTTGDPLAAAIGLAGVLIGVLGLRLSAKAG